LGSATPPVIVPLKRPETVPLVMGSTRSSRDQRGSKAQPEAGLLAFTPPGIGTVPRDEPRLTIIVKTLERTGTAVGGPGNGNSFDWCSIIGILLSLNC
jgi:hypothetical protein